MKKNLVKLTYCTEEEVFNICWKLLEEEWLLSTIDSQDEYEIQHLRKINKLEIFQSLTGVEININKLQPYYDYIKKECMTIVSTI
ncbi:MAG: hypothetical protein PHW07_09255 [Sulfurospirillaceae bacterium]|nr:hypothetical protein [Sulfurospirillaceae bacterium]